MNDQLNLGLGYSSSGSLSTTIFSGAVYDSYQMNVYVQIYDNDTAFGVYEIEQAITVYPDFSNFQTEIEQLITQSPLFRTNIILNEGSYLQSIQEIQRISSMLNEQSLSDKLGLILNGNAPIFPETFGPLSNYTGVSPVNWEKENYFLIKITFIIYNIRVKNSNMTLNSIYEINRNIRSKARDALIVYVNNISIFDMDSLRTQSGMLALLTSQTDEISRNSEVFYIPKKGSSNKNLLI